MRMFRNFFPDSRGKHEEGENRWAFATVEDFHRAFSLFRYAMSCDSDRKFPEFGKKKAAPVRYLTDEELTGTLSSSTGQSRAKFKFRATGQSLGNRRHASIVATCTHHQGTLGLNTTSLLGLAASTVAVYTQPVSYSLRGRSANTKLTAGGRQKLLDQIKPEAWISGTQCFQSATKLYSNHQDLAGYLGLPDVQALQDLKKELYPVLKHFQDLTAAEFYIPSTPPGRTRCNRCSKGGRATADCIMCPIAAAPEAQQVLDLNDRLVAGDRKVTVEAVNAAAYALSLRVIILVQATRPGRQG
ncbi:hypothetical protein LTR34_003001 [Exophiala xenobiotica]|nr:hypothetical protein LTR34_003001 [Exophiala xenobiotica]KAK5549144.1 hypothetical protein LTR23_000974 [Chaetothyriales sp. CCFEE 6169]